MTNPNDSEMRLLSRTHLLALAQLSLSLFCLCLTRLQPQGPGRQQLLWHSQRTHPFPLFTVSPASWSWSHTASWWWRRHSSVGPSIFRSPNCCRKKQRGFSCDQRGWSREMARLVFFFFSPPTTPLFCSANVLQSLLFSCVSLVVTEQASTCCRPGTAVCSNGTITLLETLQTSFNMF